jgi:hypothetical protein
MQRSQIMSGETPNLRSGRTGVSPVCEYYANVISDIKGVSRFFIIKNIAFLPTLG